MTAKPKPKSGPPPTAPPFPKSLCHTCAARRYVAGRASTFVMCTALAEKYPRQPVVVCEARRPRGR
jgi:hypothetical protein